MAQSRRREIIVIGAGIIGVCCALYLQRAGHRVILLDRAGPGEGCSKGNAGLFENNAVAPLSSPGILKKVPKLLFHPLGPLAIKWAHLPRMMPWLWRFVRQGAPAAARANAAHLAPLVQAAMPAYQPLIEAGNLADMVEDSGWIWVYQHERTLDAMSWELGLLRELDISWEHLDAGALHGKVPGLSPAARFGLFFATTRACVNPYRFVTALAGVFSANGGNIERARVSRIDPGANGTVLHTNRGRYHCDATVVAAGAWSGAFARQLGEPVPLGTERGYHVMLPHATTDLPVPLMFAEHKFVAHRLENGLRLAGTAELGGLGRPPDWRRADALLKNARTLLSGLDERDLGTWMGYRPTMPDSLPVISPSVKNRNVYYAFGHQHLGLTLGGLTGQMIAAMVDGERPAVAPHPYRINRF